MPIALVALTRAREAFGMFNADLDKPIEDGPRAIAVVMAARAALKDIVMQNDLFSETCEAPVFACDLSQLNVKTGSRVSGPLKRSLPTLSEAYGVDPYTTGDILQNVSTLEAIFSAWFRNAGDASRGVKAQERWGRVSSALTVFSFAYAGLTFRRCLRRSQRAITPE